MPAVLCGISCFDAASLTSAADVSREFIASLDPALDAPSCAVEVYRLQRLAPHEKLEEEDLVVCRIPDWQFDFQSIEDIHRKVEDMRQENDDLHAQYARAKEALIALEAAFTTADVCSSKDPEKVVKGVDGHNVEVQQLKRQLADSEKKQQETKATVIALRSEFMQLVDMMSDTTGGLHGPNALDFPMAAKDYAAKSSHSASSQNEHERYVETATPPLAHRQVQPAALIGGFRRNTGSPRSAVRAGAAAGTSWAATTRPGATRPRGVQQRGTVHSAGASGRQAQPRPQPADGGA
eukprot:TRINITY_DN39360_c0_g1_i1.p1 TRINITY_DN39360_c0_g1~~TRINITY_DN39360_c0_g1_i1.p1  ORF type:complete len:294 (+),score=57.18 TRINITY_DN39360_c0_g1_i1:92-973(+)